MAAINHEQDAQIDSRWTLDGDYLRMLGADLVRPLSPAQVKKGYDEIEKEIEEKGNQYYFTIIHLKGDMIKRSFDRFLDREIRFGDLLP